jgi:hypothetical protein
MAANWRGRKMAGTSETSRYDVCVVCLYAYGREALLRIEDDGKKFVLQVPEFDLLELERELDSESGLPLASAKEFLTVTTFVSQTMKQMRKGGTDSWSAPRSSAWWERSRQAVIANRK